MVATIFAVNPSSRDVWRGHISRSRWRLPFAVLFGKACGTRLCQLLASACPNGRTAHDQNTTFSCRKRWDLRGARNLGYQRQKVLSTAMRPIGCRHDQIVDTDDGDMYAVGAHQAVVRLNRDHLTGNPARMRAAGSVKIADYVQRIQLPRSSQPMLTGTTATRLVFSITA